MEKRECIWLNYENINSKQINVPHLYVTNKKLSSKVRNSGQPDKSLSLVALRR